MTQANAEGKKEKRIQGKKKREFTTFKSSSRSKQPGKEPYSIQEGVRKTE